MESKVAERIIELARKWQDLQSWRDTFSALRLQSLEVKQAVLTDGEESRRCWANVKTIHQELEVPRAELRELADLVREHRPDLLTLVPVVDFAQDRPPDADLIRWAENLRTLEAAVREPQRQPQGDDLTAYLPASKVNNGKFSLPALNKVLAKIPAEIIRRKRIGKNRLLIHVADWVRYWDEQERLKLDALDTASIAGTIVEIEKRREKEKANWTTEQKEQKRRK